MGNEGTKEAPQYFSVLCLLTGNKFGILSNEKRLISFCLTRRNFNISVYIFFWLSAIYGANNH